jgi:hypothetical protein
MEAIKMGWKDRYKQPQPITNISQLNIGDLVYYIKIGYPDIKRYGRITKINTDKNVIWAYWGDNIEDIEGELLERFIIVEPDIEVFKINGGKQNGN